MGHSCASLSHNPRSLTHEGVRPGTFTARRSAELLQERLPLHCPSCTLDLGHDHLDDKLVGIDPLAIRKLPTGIAPRKPLAGMKSRRRVILRRTGQEEGIRPDRRVDFMLVSIDVDLIRVIEAGEARGG